MRHPGLLHRDRSLLVVIDVQEPFLATVKRKKTLVKNIQLLAQAASAMKIPVVATVQNAPRMGQTISKIQTVLPPGTPEFDKLCFSSAGSTGFMNRLEESGRRQIVLCGIMAHVCVSQTAHDLIARGFEVHTAADAVSSASRELCELGLERMSSAGVRMCAAEAAVFEWLYEAGTPEFKAVLPLLK